MALESERPSHLVEIDRAREALNSALPISQASMVILRIAIAFQAAHEDWLGIDAYHVLIGGSIDYEKMYRRPECVDEIINLIHEATTQSESSPSHPQEGNIPVE